MSDGEATVEVRRAVPADRAFVLSLAARFAETRPLWRTEAEVTSGTERALARAFDAPHDDEAVFVAATRARGLVAFAYAIEDADFFTGEPHAHVSEIAALPGGTGAGVPLVRAIETWARARGSRYVSLHVNERNPKARALYERLGFTLEYERMAKVLVP